MLARIGPHLSFANVVSVVALFVALGGASYAAINLPNNSVKSKHIKDGQVKSQDVKDDNLTGEDLDESQLGEVPTAGDSGLLDGKDSTDFVLPGSEGWHPMELNNDGTGAICNWTNVGGDRSPAAYFRDATGVVHFRGLIKAVNGTSTDCQDNDVNSRTVVGFHTLHLPAGYRPEHSSLFETVSNSAAGSIDVKQFGAVQIVQNYPPVANAREWVSLEGISYRCGPSGPGGCP